MKKYELLKEDTLVKDGIVLYRIKALIDIPKYVVKAGDLGGYIASEECLSHEGNCWVEEYSYIYPDARVLGNALVRRSVLKGISIVEDKGSITDSELNIVNVRGSGYIEHSKLKKASVEDSGRIICSDLINSYVKDEGDIEYSTLRNTIVKDKVYIKDSTLKKVRARGSGHIKHSYLINVKVKGNTYIEKSDLTNIKININSEVKVIKNEISVKTK